MATRLARQVLGEMVAQWALVLLLFVAVAALVLHSGHRATAETAKGCPDGCSGGTDYTYDSEWMGGVECAHGPEHNPAGTCFKLYAIIGGQVAPGSIDNCCESAGDIPAGFQVYKVKAGGAVPPGVNDLEACTVVPCDQAGACHCFQCNGVAGCEPRFKSWTASCGSQSSGAFGNDDCPVEEVPGTTDNDVVTMHRATLPDPEGVPCNGVSMVEGEDKLTQEFCGGGQTPPSDFADCIGNNCLEDPSAPWIPQDRGKKYQCKAQP
jgi:hypothetical protein